MNSLKKGEGVPLLNFEGGPGVPLLNFRGVPGPTFKLWGGFQGPEVLVPLLHHAVSMKSKVQLKSFFKKGFYNIFKPFQIDMKK